MIFVDTGDLLAVLNPGDDLFERAQRWAAVVHEPLITTEYVIWEAANSMSDPLDRPKVHAAVAEIQGSASWELVSGSPRLFEEGLSLHQQRSD